MKENFNISRIENIINLDPIKIEKDNNNYYLNIGVNKDKIVLSLKDKEQLLSINYIKTMNIQEIKDLNKAFYVLNSFNEFYEYLKLLSENKKIDIKKSEEKISILLNIEVLFKQEIIEINLFPGKIDLELNIRNIYKELLYIKETIKDIGILKKENKELREKVEKQSKEINDIKEKQKEIKELKDKIEKQEKELNNIKENEINKLKNIIKFEKIKNENFEIISFIEQKKNENNLLKENIDEENKSNKEKEIEDSNSAQKRNKSKKKVIKKKKIKNKVLNKNDKVKYNKSDEHLYKEIEEKEKFDELSKNEDNIINETYKSDNNTPQKKKSKTPIKNMKIKKSKDLNKNNNKKNNNDIFSYSEDKEIKDNELNNKSIILYIFNFLILINNNILEIIY